jgi:hypothetical protein
MLLRDLWEGVTTVFGHGKGGGTRGHTVRKYRCTTGPRKGRVVAKAATCNAPKNVKASHGLADYGLESRQRLFLQARGLNDKQVKAMMIKAFGRVILDHISLVCLQEGK